MGENNNFAERFRHLVEESPYTQRQIAMLCNITEASLSRYMNGERIPKAEILANLATTLHTTTDYLLGNPNPFTDYAEVKALVARSRQKMTPEQKKELADLLLSAADSIGKENI